MMDKRVEVIIPPEKLMGGPETSSLKETLCSLPGGGKKVFLNLSNVRWINSAGLGLLISVHLMLRKRGSGLVLVNPSAKVRSLLRITKLMSIFDIRKKAA